MGWTDAFPVFDDEQLAEFEQSVTLLEREELDEWYDVERVINSQPEARDVVSVSLFWKNVREGDEKLPTPTREILQNAQEMGLAKRFNPWDHYVKPLLELVPELRLKFPGVCFRVYLAKDMEFLADELAAAGNEVHVMRSSSICFAPGGLWRFLPFAEEGKRVTVTDVDRLGELAGDLSRSKTMDDIGLGAWRVPVPTDLSGDRRVSYLPFMGCQFGVQGGLLDVSRLLKAFTWHANRGNIETTVIFPGCGPLQIQSHKWPSYGFDEYFMTVAAYPRYAQHGMLTFVPAFAKSQLLALDVEYVTWGNPKSELVYFPGDRCCGIETTAVAEIPPAHDFKGLDRPLLRIVDEEPTSATDEPEVAFLFLTRGDLHQEQIWDEYLSATSARPRIHAHSRDLKRLSSGSMIADSQIARRVETEWGSVSLVTATLALLQTALEDRDRTHFILVSESCVPVRPFSQLLRSLRLDGRTRMRVQPWSEVRGRNILKAQRLENLQGIRKEIAHFQDQWMCLNREDATLLIEKDMTGIFADVVAPDEAYFATVLAASGRPPLQTVANRPITWTHWNEGDSHPETFTKVSPRVAAEIADSGCFFARKFAVESNIGDWGLHKEAVTSPNHAEKVLRFEA